MGVVLHKSNLTSIFSKVDILRHQYVKVPSLATMLPQVDSVGYDTFLCWILFPPGSG